MRESITIEMFLDVSCPWCHGALGTNRRILDEFAADDTLPSLAVRWRFLRLKDMPRPGGLPLEEYYAILVGDDPGEVVEARATVQDYASSVGVIVDEARHTYLHDPLLAHRLLALVRDEQHVGDDLPDLWGLARAVFSANFAQGVDIADVEQLRGAVREAGIAVPDWIWRILEREDGHLAETLVDRTYAQSIGLDGVPRMYVGGVIVPTWIDQELARITLREAIDSDASTAGR